MANQLNHGLIMLLRPQTGLIIAGGISAALLGGALLFQYVGGMAPCELCIWQRWPHVAIIGLALMGLCGVKPRVMLGLILIAGIISVGLGGYHAGIEWGLWAGPTGCTANLDFSGDISKLTQQLLATDMVRCDQVVWSLLGLSMAGWNALVSLDIIAIALISLLRAVR